MNKIKLFDRDSSFSLVIEGEAFAGVKEIGKTVAEDLEMVTGKLPETVEKIDDASTEAVVLFATVGKSTLLDELDKAGLVNLALIRGKREVFLMKVIGGGALREAGVAATGTKQVLVIAGSDKRGTIYGMFHLSELCGVSPLVYFGDAYPEKRDVLEIEIEENEEGGYVSKKPSVYYRGFFINDEWPAFGNWATEKFGGVNAKCYRRIFELLLRMKGNYMWPAMWNSNFSEDGPGIENARLADELGVVMGTSHHEPLFRAGNEWQQQYQKYGDDNSWSFLSNEKAITKFWEDGVRRNKDFESVITIGMRGEADSKLLPEDATMKDNIEVVKKAILAQDGILSQQFGKEYDSTPRMLAIYKEVEDYYYGDDTCEGLKDWDELKDAIFLLSDDNHGNLRNLPTEAERKHPGGYGMYYHFDYHGAPISYEWTNCNRLTKTWEQMTTAYEAGVRKMWIVNVGDLKEMEYPLSFFMDLAYDYENYGLSALNKIESYVYSWIDRQFGSRITDSQKKDVFTVLEGYTRFNALRTPETMNEKIYHPVNYGEGERVLSEARRILAVADRLKSELTGEALLTYESMIYYAAAASLNLVIAWVLTSMNHELAKAGDKRANDFIPEIEERIELDKALVKEFHEILDGEWNHCLSSAHTGFRTWNDEVWFYPEPIKVTEDMAKEIETTEAVSDDEESYICLGADSFSSKRDVEGAGFEVVNFLGREGSAIKAFPPMKIMESADKAPFVSYDIEVSEAGEYDVIFYMLTRNPYFKGGRLSFYVSVNDKEPVPVHGVAEGYYTEWQDVSWAQGVLRAGRCVETPVALNKGKNELRIYAKDPGVILEKFVIKKKEYELLESYLGPQVNY